MHCVLGRCLLVFVLLVFVFVLLFLLRLLLVCRLRPVAVRARDLTGRPTRHTMNNNRTQQTSKNQNEEEIIRPGLACRHPRVPAASWLLL